MKKKVSSRNGVMTLKLDMSKAYDRVWADTLCCVPSHAYDISYFTSILNDIVRH